MMLSRRSLIAGSFAMPGVHAADDVAAYRTPHKYGKLVVAASGEAGAFDSRSVDCPYVFHARGRFYMTYVGFDGTGYQTGLASSSRFMPRARPW